MLNLLIFVSFTLVAFGIFGAVLLFRYSVLSWAERRWRLTGQPIHFGMVGATCYGTGPTASYQRRQGDFGAVGIVGDQFVFATRTRENFSVPLASITWIGMRRIKVRRGRYSHRVMALMVHGEDREEYFVLALSSHQLFSISQQLSARCKLLVEDLGDRSESYGPAMTTRVTQDIHGEWHEDAPGTLFLAPDRLMFATYEGWIPALPLAQIREIGAFSRGGVLNSLNPFAEDLLRVEYQPTPDGKPEVIGFLVRNADDWADAIQARSSARITVHAGRKKKAG